MVGLVLVRGLDFTLHLHEESQPSYTRGMARLAESPGLWENKTICERRKNIKLTIFLLSKTDADKQLFI